MTAARKKKRKKVRYKKIEVKISDNQRKKLEKVVKIKHTTVNKLVRTLIDKQIKFYSDRLNEPVSQVSEKQLSLFEHE